MEHMDFIFDTDQRVSRETYSLRSAQQLLLDIVVPSFSNMEIQSYSVTDSSNVYLRREAEKKRILTVDLDFSADRSIDADSHLNAIVRLNVDYK